MNLAILNMEVRLEHDVVLARQRARQIASLLGFDSQDQTRIATAVSEIARNAFQYAGGGRIEFAVSENEPSAFQITVHDKGPGIKDLQRILDGQYTSTTGMGMGIIGVRRLMDRFEIESTPNAGATVRIGKNLPKRLPGGAAPHVGKITEELARRPSQSPFEEVQQQNQELLSALQQLQERQAELEKQRQQLALLNHELEDTNRGVVALYSELDEKADYLRRASEMKSRFLSNMSHEFRTPLNSITGLAQLLLDRTDGELSAEQDKQVRFVKKAAEDLTELVNDLLDLAKVEAGKVVIRAHEFNISALFGALRGMLRPLLAHNSSLSLILDDPVGVPPLETDEGKVSQILRNFISNALKYTERGEIRVSASVNADETIRIAVSDPGIGISIDDQERIFQEFVQLDGDRQKRVKGTGLGLPLSRKLAELLGGSITVQSAPGVGSTFSLIIPRVYHGPTEVTFVPEIVAQRDPSRLPVLVVEDNRETLFIYEKYLKGTGFQIIPARTLKSARRAINEFQPVAVVLDVLLESESTWEFLAEIKSEPRTKKIPVFVVTMVENQHKAIALGADDFSTKPVERAWLLDRLRSSARPMAPEKILLIDDDEVSRYLLKGLLGDTRFAVIEAVNGREGLQTAEKEQPRAIFLDLDMPEMSGYEVLSELRSNAATKNIPVIINTSRVLEDRDYERLDSKAVFILSKATSSREVAIASVREALVKAGVH